MRKQIPISLIQTLKQEGIHNIKEDSVLPCLNNTFVNILKYRITRLGDGYNIILFLCVAVHM